MKAAENNPTNRLGIPERCCTLDIRGRKETELVRMFKALGNPTRFKIMKFLLTHPGCITGEIVNEVGLAQSTVSQHLAVLKGAGWVRGNIQGPATCYCLDPERIRLFKKKIAEIF